MLSRLHVRLRRWRRRWSRAEWFVRRGDDAARHSTEHHDPGILLIQIDGLSRAELERAMAKHRLPWLRRLLKREGYQLHDFYSGLPSSTPAVQGELHYGVRCAVPAFSFLDDRTGRIDMMMHPEPAKRIEAELAAQNEGLLTDGSSWSNIYTGGAGQKESHFCGASLGFGDIWRTGKLRHLAGLACLHLASFARMIALLPVEFVLAISDAVRGVLARRQPWQREFIFVFARALVCIGLRELITIGAKVDLARGRSIIHVNFLGYDEQSHRRGPSSAFAHWTLKGIDRAIGRLHRAARRAQSRDYDVWIFSDHGQIRSSPFSRHVDGGLEGLARRLLLEQKLIEEGDGEIPVWRSQSKSSAAGWLGGPRRAVRMRRAQLQSELSQYEREVVAVASMGPVGHLYFACELSADALRLLAAGLVRHGVPGVLIPEPEGRALWLTAHGEYQLPDHHDMLPHVEGLRPLIAQDLATLAHQPHSGHLIALGWSPQCGQAITFADENGSHAGCSPEETGAFLMLPGQERPLVSDRPMRPAELRQLARAHLGRIDAPQRRPQPPARIQHETTPTGRTLRIVTYNVHACIGLDGRCSPARIARVLARYDADVIVLQELDCKRSRTRGENQLDEIAAQLGMKPVWCQAVDCGEGAGYGHGLLSRLPVTAVRSQALPGPERYERRAALHVTLDWHDRPLHVISTHLGLARMERRIQVLALCGDELLGTVPADEPVILAGDLNTAPGAPAYRLLARSLHEVQAHCPGHVGRPTFPSMMPLRQLDHIFTSAQLQAHRVTVPADELIRRASDHLPVVADLKEVPNENDQTAAAPPAPTALYG